MGRPGTALRLSSPADVFDFIIDLSQALNSASYIWDHYHYIFQSKVFVLVSNDDGHAFDIWEYIRDGKRSSVAKLIPPKSRS